MEKIEISRENVLSTAMEGGGFDIYRVKYDDGSIMFDESTGEIFGADDLDMTEEEFQEFMKRLKRTYQTFDEFWEKFSQQRSIEKMFYLFVAEEYKELVRNGIIEKLRLRGVSEKGIIKHMKNRFENENFR